MTSEKIKDKIIYKLNTASPDRGISTGVDRWDRLTFNLQLTGEELEYLFASLKSQLAEAGEEKWTDNDIDAAYLFGLICASGYADVKVNIDNPFPSFDIINKEIRRLKELGCTSPHNAIRALRKPY